MKSNPILESIRKETNAIKADSVRGYSYGRINEEVQEVLSKTVRERFGMSMDQLVMDLLSFAAWEALKPCTARIAALDGSREAQEAIVQSICSHGGRLATMFKNHLGFEHGAGALGDLKKTVADTISKIVSEAMVTEALTQTSKRLPLPKED